MPDTDIPVHHGSHRNLVWSDTRALADRSLANGVDAIVVPTARHPAYLTEAAALAMKLNCTLVTLHSKRWTSAAKAAQRVPADIDLIAIDIPEPSVLHLPSWETSSLLAGTVFARRTDVSAKRNLALALARMLGWTRILFLDDDITQLRPNDVRYASSLLSTHHVAGLHIGGFPDNSVVCHAYREAGGSQQTFVGAGALTVRIGHDQSFFPDIYNEDWFFLLDRDKGLQSVAVTGEVRQYPYDPFRSPDRARREELGDVLAEGIFWLLDQGQSIADASEEYWASFLEQRRQFIIGVLKMVKAQENLGPADRTRRIEALKGSLGRWELITPGLCQRYLAAWVRDRDRWQRHLERLPEVPSRIAALGALSKSAAEPLAWEIRQKSTSTRHLVTVPVLATNRELECAPAAR